MIYLHEGALYAFLLFSGLQALPFTWNINLLCEKSSISYNNVMLMFIHRVAAKSQSGIVPQESFHIVET